MKPWGLGMMAKGPWHDIMTGMMRGGWADIMAMYDGLCLCSTAVGTGPGGVEDQWSLLHCMEQLLGLDPFFSPGPTSGASLWGSEGLNLSTALGGH